MTIITNIMGMMITTNRIRSNSMKYAPKPRPKATSGKTGAMANQVAQDTVAPFCSGSGRR